MRPPPSRKRIGLPLLALTLAGCVTVADTQHFTYRGPAQIPGGTLRLDGYYFQEETRVEGEYGTAFPGHTGTLIRSLVLWEDGTAAYMGVWQGKALPSGEFETRRYGTLREALEEFEGEADSLLSGERGTRADWGAFRLRGDSISIQVVAWVASALPRLYSTVEYNGVVLNDTTFVLTERIGYAGWYRGTRAHADTLRFRPFAGKPPSANWTRTHPALR